MSSRKRPATEPLSPPHSPKHPRLSLEIPDRDPPKSKKIIGRWWAMAKDMTELVMDTISAIASLGLSSPTPSSSSPEPDTPSLVDEARLSSSPVSSSLDTPPQSPSPRTRSDANLSSTPKQRPGISIQSPPTNDTHQSDWASRDPPSEDESFRIFDDANFSTPKAQRVRSTSSDHITLETSSPNNASNSSGLNSSGTPKSQESRDSSTRTTQTSKSPTLIAVPKSRNHVSRKPGRRGSHQPIKKRKHIYDDVHKAHVKRYKLELREELSQRFYQAKISHGYRSSYPEFKGWLSYKKTLEDLNSAPSVSGLLGPPAQSSGTSQDGIVGDDLTTGTTLTNEIPQTPEYLQRALDIFDATMNGPKPPRPNIPSIDELAARKKAKQEAIDKLLRPPPLPTSLSPEEEQQVSALLRQRGVISKFAREQVSDQDISRLRPGQWLNDEIINFYGAMILARSEGSKENPTSVSKDKGKAKMKAPLNVHYFSSFFWTKMTQEGYDKGRLAKWTKKLDIFSKDAILIPVNHGNAHWTAASINFRQKRFESYDSMNMAKSKVFQVLRSYVNSEHMNKRNKPFNFDGWEDWAPASTPQQENGYDCGVFTCQFLESLSRGEDFFNFSQADMHYLRRRMIWEIGNSKLYNSR
ncbi:Sentrin-specific protease 1 [Psilocybe cubensis]|uniref:Ubiquitin-like protease family profile domain-containing protein n=2 Tax=Psilocybe cubensis TaxID=181762 RepID=A0A8H7YAW3_PSICU|nr:Sentrin-specific protease 1 [Psilocybe cubensis]KAH9487128.1 Sentrin-specific protease 1 [Psilocybe cubensis]